MDVLLVTLGTAGDVHPFVALGKELKTRGHRVTLVTNDVFEPVAERVGLEFTGIGSADHYYSVLANPDIWKPVRGFKILVQELIHGCMRPTYEAIEALHTDHTVVVAPCFMFGARAAQEKLSVPLVTVILQPSSVWSTAEPTSISTLDWAHRLPASLQSLMAKALGRFFLERLIAPGANRFRSELGLPPAKGIATEWLYSPDCVIGLFPDWFAPPAVDWPTQLIQTGFVSHESFDSLSLPVECRSFLEEGDAPIAFTPGSGNKHATQFFEVAVKSCQELNQRGLLLTGFSDHLPSILPSTVRHFDYVPFDQVFPLCKAVVHHGGIGTLGKAFAAGIPQLIMPMAYDQPDNAQRLKTLGVGDMIRPDHFKPPLVTQKLRHLIASEKVQRQCKTLSSRIDSTATLAQTCSLIESVKTVAVSTKQ